MKINLRLALAAAAVAAFAAPAFAQQGAGGPPTPEQRAARFDRMDANHDGKLTKEEFVAAIPEAMKANADAIWARMSGGKDSVTKEQFLATPPMPRPPQ